MNNLLVELVSNESLLEELFKDDEMNLYPDWTGTTERVEKSIVVDVQNETITQ